MLRKAFADTMRDKGFLQEADKMDINIDPVSAEEITQTIMDTINAPPTIIAKAKEVMGAGK
jgi:hypothetical protein